MEALSLSRYLDVVTCEQIMETRIVPIKLLFISIVSLLLVSLFCIPDTTETTPGNSCCQDSSNIVDHNSIAAYIHNDSCCTACIRNYSCGTAFIHNYSCSTACIDNESCSTASRASYHARSVQHHEQPSLTSYNNNNQAVLLVISWSLSETLGEGPSSPLNAIQLRKVLAYHICLYINNRKYLPEFRYIITNTIQGIKRENVINFKSLAQSCVTSDVKRYTTVYINNRT